MFFIGYVFVQCNSFTITALKAVCFGNPFSLSTVNDEMKRSAILFLFVLTWVIIGIGFYFLNRNPSPTTDTPVVRVGSVSGDLSNRVDFVNAAQLVTPAVVHIKTRSSSGGGLGSGVIIAENGYIATNNHVIENAETITVILPDRRNL